MAPRYRIQLFRTVDLAPVDGQWQPAVELWELVEANERLELAALPLRWRVAGSPVPKRDPAPRVAPSYGA
jgi:hypothetical protein